MKETKSKTNNKKTLQVILNVPIELNEKYKELAQSQGVPKSYIFLTALNYYLDYKDTIKTMPKLIEMMNEEMNKNKSLNG